MKADPSAEKVAATVCCLCHRLKGPRGWQHQPLPPASHLSHGYCPDCFREVERELAQLGESLSRPRDRRLVGIVRNNS